MLKIALYLSVAAVSLTPAAAWDPKECHQYLAQETNLEGPGGPGWSGHSFNASKRYITYSGGSDNTTKCKKISKALKVLDSVYLSGNVTADGGVVTAKSGSGRWAGEVKMYVSPSFAGCPTGCGGSATPLGKFTNSHVCTTINGVQLHAKILWGKLRYGFDALFLW
jgi:hypothetical protein